jgi:hypothetical protein
MLKETRINFLRKHRRTFCVLLNVFIFVIIQQYRRFVRKQMAKTIDLPCIWTATLRIHFSTKLNDSEKYRSNARSRYLNEIIKGKIVNVKHKNVSLKKWKKSHELILKYRYIFIGVLRKTYQFRINRFLFDFCFFKEKQFLMSLYDTPYIKIFFIKISNWNCHALENVVVRQVFN